MAYTNNENNKFRLNVGCIVINKNEQVLLAKRIDIPDSWQFPQGGIKKGEKLNDTLGRELKEEIGLSTMDYNILGVTKKWTYYSFPKEIQNKQSYFAGQKQKWFLVELISNDEKISLNNNCSKAEFCAWKWVSYWYPLNIIAKFKYFSYKQAMYELRYYIP